MCLSRVLSGRWRPGPQLRPVQPCAYRPQPQGIHPAPPQQPWGAQSHWEAVHWGWLSNWSIDLTSSLTLQMSSWRNVCLWGTDSVLCPLPSPPSPGQSGWRVQGEVLPPERHDRRWAGPADQWSLPVRQARVPPADLRRHGPWLARRQRHLVRDTDTHWTPPGSPWLETKNMIWSTVKSDSVARWKQEYTHSRPPSASSPPPHRPCPDYSCFQTSVKVCHENTVITRTAPLPQWGGAACKSISVQLSASHDSHDSYLLNVTPVKLSWLPSPQAQQWQDLPGLGERGGSPACHLHAEGRQHEGGVQTLLRRPEEGNAQNIREEAVLWTSVYGLFTAVKIHNVYLSFFLHC